MKYIFLQLLNHLNGRLVCTGLEYWVICFDWIDIPSKCGYIMRNEAKKKKISIHL